jgi:hypothetical protein
MNRHSSNSRSRRRGGAVRTAGWLAAAAMLVVAAFAPATAQASAANNVNSISVPQCFVGGMSGTLDVTVGAAPFEFDIWVTDHIPGEGFWVEIPGSRISLSIDASDAAYPFGPLDVSQHRDGVNSYRVETDGGSAKSASIHPCDDATPTPTPEVTPTPTPEVTPTPTPEVTPTPTPEVTPTPTPEVTPTPTPEVTPTPTPEVTPTPTPEATPTPTGSELPAESENPTPSGGVEGATGTPSVTVPPTDALGQGTSSTSESWRIILAGLASLIATVLVFTQPTRSRRSR